MKDFYVGVDVGGTNIKSALVKNGKVLRRAKLPTNGPQGPVPVINQIKKAIRTFSKPLAGIGIGIAGIIDSKKGIVRYSPNLIDWNNIKLAQAIRDEFSIPVHILNDVNAICLGEWKFGAAKGHNSVFLFTLGTGVGGAAVCEGHLLFGANGFAGEYDGKKCTCGQFGHLEGYVGARFIAARARRMMKQQPSALNKYKKITPHIIAREAKKGDALSKKVFEQIGFYIGIGVSSIISLFDPDIIIISGGISKAGRILFEPIRKTVAQRVMGAQFRKYKIVQGKLGDDAGILGAVYYASRY